MKIYFIGIGGIGVSALAQYYLEKSAIVSGSDLTASETTDFLKKKGVKIHIGEQKAKNVPKDIDLAVYSPAVNRGNPELRRCFEMQKKSKSLRVLSYPQALGQLTKKYFTIAVSGTHGKSTTASMLGLIMEKAALDPTVIIGTKLKEFGETNFRMGRSKYLLIEADEWRASFLNYFPNIIILTNIEKEHLDYYKNLKHILETYRKYIKRLPENGVLVANLDDKNIKKIIFGKNTAELNKISIFNFQALKQKYEEKLKKLLKVPGEHNLINALTALKTAQVLNIPDEIILCSLSEYCGAWRRFEEKEGKIGKTRFTLISDYGHHPSEITATMKAVNEKFKERKIWLVFQPHQYQRTFYLFKDFLSALRKMKAEKIIITDIFDVAGRENEKMKKGVNAKKLAEKTGKENIIYLPREKIIGFLEKKLKGGEVLVIMGAGNIDELFRELSTEKN